MGKKQRGPLAKASKHEMKERRLAKENEAAKQQQKDTSVNKVDAETFESDVQQVYEKHLLNLSKKAGLQDYDSDEELIQPMLPMNVDDDDDESEESDSDNEQEDIQISAMKKQLASLEKKEGYMDQSDDESEEENEYDEDMEEMDELEMKDSVSDTSEEEEMDTNASSSSDNDEDEGENRIKRSAAALVSVKDWKKTDFHEEQNKISQKRKINDDKEREYQEDEEAEVLEIQRKRADRLTNNEVLDDVFGDVLNQKRKKKDTKESLVAKKVDLETSNLTDSEKMKIIMEETPELIELFSELKERLQTVREQIDPLLSKIKTQQYTTEDGLSYLEIKLHLMLSYCINIIFYMLLKSSGRSVKDHPVIDKLVEMRMLLEKIRPIDERMKSQISKLISLATAQGISQPVPVDYRAQPEQFESSDEEASSGEDENGQEPSDDEAIQEKKKKKQYKPSLDLVEEEEEEDQVYKAPKLVPVAYDDAVLKKAKGDLKRLEKKIKNSEMIKAFKASMSDEPEEIANIGSEIKQSSFLKEREEQELESFTRRNLTKKELKKMREEREKTVDELRDLESFTDIEALEKYSKAKAATNTKVTLAQYIGDAAKAEEELEKMNKPDNENNIDALDEEEKYLRASGVLTEYSDEDEEEDEEDEEEPEPAVKPKKVTFQEPTRKRKRETNGKEESVKKKKNRMQVRDEEDSLLETDMRDANGKRLATKEIIENRGLVARKKKEQRNPRVKHKMKYKKKAGSILKMQKLQKGGQDGMVKSVSKSLVRSKKLKP